MLLLGLALHTLHRYSLAVPVGTCSLRSFGESSTAAVLGKTSVDVAIAMLFTAIGKYYTDFEYRYYDILIRSVRILLMN